MKKLPILIFCYFICSFNNPSIAEQIYKNYCKAVDDAGSTFEYFVVIEAIDEINGTKKKVCLTSFELVSSLASEWKIHYKREYKVIRRIKRTKNRSFKFKSEAGLEYINRIKYSEKELESFSAKVNIDSIVSEISKKTKWNYWAENEKEEIMMAHLLFDKGILVGINGCVMNGLEYYKNID